MNDKSKVCEKIRDIFCYKRWECEVYAFVSAVVLGFIAHGFIFLNNITLHDNIYNFYMGGTYTSGRWMLAKLLRLSQIVYDTNYLHYSTPWYLGIVSLVFLGLSAAVIIYLLQIKNKISAVLIGGIMVAFPAVTSMFGYMFTAGMYSLGIFIGMVGTALVCMATKVKGLVRVVPALLGVLLQACSVGVYQANISLMLSLTVLFFIHSLVSEELSGVVRVCKRILYYGLESLGYLVTYYAASLYFVKRVGESLSSYRGISEVGNTGIGEYLSRIFVAYGEFVNPTAGQSKYMYMGGVSPFYTWLLVIILGMSVILLWTRFAHKWFERIICLLAIAVMPICVNLIYIMVEDGIYSLMVYGEVMVFVLAIYLCERIQVKGRFILRLCTVLPIAVTIVLYARYANVCYLKADYVQKAGISYFDRMINRMESEEGYVPGMPVVFIGEKPTLDETVYLYSEFSDVHIWPYEFDSMVNNYNWYEFMKSHCGFRAPMGDAGKFAENEIVVSMPCYPAAGSVRVVEDCVIIKLEE